MQKIIHFLLLPFAFLVIVVPNSFQTFTISIFTLLFLLILISVKRIYDIRLLIFWVVISLLFSVFIFASPIDDANKLELVFKYIISPLFWITIVSYVRMQFSIDDIMKYLILLGFISNLSVPILYITMSAGYVSIVEYIIKAPNIDQNTGLGFTLHVYGSLIFFAIAVMPSLFYIRKIAYKIIYIFSFIVAAVLSARSAFLFLILVGLSFGIFYIKKTSINIKNIFIFIFLGLLLLQFSFTQYSKYFDVDIVDYFESTHINKVKEVGGEARVSQTNEMLEQFYKNPLGSGFVTLDTIRDEVKTYSYEVLILATLVRFGLVTFLVILYSLFSSLGNIFSSNVNMRKQAKDILIFGFIAILISSFTNPYLESFCFQWMYFLPLIFLKKHLEFRNK